MSEICMDDIDRALAREHGCYHDGCSLDEEMKAIQSGLKKPVAPERIDTTPCFFNIHTLDRKPYHPGHAGRLSA